MRRLRNGRLAPSYEICKRCGQWFQPSYDDEGFVPNPTLCTRCLRGEEKK